MKRSRGTQQTQNSSIHSHEVSWVMFCPDASLEASWSFEALKLEARVGSMILIEFNTWHCRDRFRQCGVSNFNRLSMKTSDLSPDCEQPDHHTWTPRSPSSPPAGQQSSHHRSTPGFYAAKHSLSDTDRPCVPHLQFFLPSARLTSHGVEYPMPKAPMILPRESRKCAPHDSFLCHAQSPDTCIAVETFMSENRLIVWLPGFMGNHMWVA